MKKGKTKLESANIHFVLPDLLRLVLFLFISSFQYLINGSLTGPLTIEVLKALNSLFFSPDIDIFIIFIYL